MKTQIATALAALSLTATLLLQVGRSQDPQDPKKAPSPDDIAAMMMKSEKWTKPGERHKLLEKFVGKWDSEVRFFMGTKAMPPEKGTAEFSWLMDGRWLQYRWEGQLMRHPSKVFSLLGYDNFKMSYVMTSVNSADTSMNRAEGDLDPKGKALLMYGTLDEYLTGEHDKMVKFVWRFIDADSMALEIHDLPIGEENTKVLEFSYKRSKG